MANDIVTNIQMRCDDSKILKSFVDSVRGFESDFSFNGIVEMPKRLRDGVYTPFGPIAFNAWYGDGKFALDSMWAKREKLDTLQAVRSALTQFHPSAVEEADYMLKNHDHCGYLTASDWALAYWGVSGDAMYPECLSVARLQAEWQFTTKHTFPEKLLTAMVERFPDISISGSFFGDADDYSGEVDYEPGGTLKVKLDDEIKTSETAGSLDAMSPCNWF